jgi:hypothetical protein
VHPATGGADPTGPPTTYTVSPCTSPGASPGWRALPVGAGRAPPTSCGS